MIKKIIISIALFSIHISAQTPKLIGPPGGYVNQITIHPQYTNIIYTTHREGAMFRSNNGGESVVPIETNMGSSSTYQIAVPPQDTNYIYSSINNYSIKSKNKGKDWEIIYESTSFFETVYEFNPLNSNIIYMTREEKELWRSNNKGESWFLVKSFERNLTDVKIAPTDTSVIYCAAEFGIYRSNDAGLSWEKVSGASYTNETEQIKVNPFNKNSIYFLLGNLLHKSIDGGRTTQRLFDDGLNRYLLDPNDTLTIYLVADLFKYNDGNLLKSTDGGLNWERIIGVIPGRDMVVHSIAIDPGNSDILYAGVGGLGVYKSLDGANNWFLTNLSYSFPYFIYLLNKEGSNILFTSAGEWGLLKKTDSENNWIEPTFDVRYNSINSADISFNQADKNIGFLGSNYYLLKTIDGGNNWQNTMSQLIDVNSIKYHPLNPAILFAGSRSSADNWPDALLHRSIDSGENWSEVLNIGNNESVRGFIFHPLEKNIVYAYSYNKILKSTDIGITWVEKNDGLLFSEGHYKPILQLVINTSNPEILFCVQRAIGTDDGGLSKSSNGGESWSQIDLSLKLLDSQTSVSSILLDKNEPSRIFLGMLTHGQPLTEKFSNGGLFFTEDAGIIWRKIYDGQVNVIKADNSNPRNIYFGTKFGIMTIVDTFHVTDVKDLGTTIPLTYSLHQNYPNPFNPTTAIKYDLVKKSKVDLRIYNILGQEIITLVNKLEDKGSKTVLWNGRDNFNKKVSSGIYFYRISAGEWNDIKKMILLK